MRPYKPRRQTARWLDGDCPREVLAIFDNRGKSFDRFTVVYATPICGDSYATMRFCYLGASDNPTHPQGFGQHGEFSAHELACYRAAMKRDNVKWSSLPEALRNHVKAECKESSNASV